MDDEKGNEIDHAEPVIDLEQQRKKREWLKAEKEKQTNADNNNTSDEASMTELQFTVIQALNNEIEGAALPRPDTQIALTLNSKDEKIIIEIDKDLQCKPIDRERVAEVIAKYVHFKVQRPGYRWSNHSIESCARLWFQLTYEMPKPSIFEFKSETSKLTYNRLPFDLDINASTPKWDAFFSRLGDPDSLKCWLWSVFEPNSYSQQYYYIRGEGGDGKGILAKILHRLLLSFYAGVQRPPSGDSRFFAPLILNKRLLVCSDLRDPTFLMSAFLMGVTGGDLMSLEQKGKELENYYAFTKVLLFSQLKPVISDQRAHLRRILYDYIAPDPNFVFDAAYQEALWAELAGMLAQCKAIYERHCPNHEPIEQNSEAKKAVLKLANMEFEAIAEDKLFFDRQPEKLFSERPFIASPVFERFLKREFPNDKKTEKPAEFKAWLVKQGVIKRGFKKFAPDGNMLYFGVGFTGSNFLDETD